MTNIRRWAGISGAILPYFHHKS